MKDDGDLNGNLNHRRF